jgi:hypothetical protein
MACDQPDQIRSQSHAQYGGIVHGEIRSELVTSRIACNLEGFTQNLGKEGSIENEGASNELYKKKSGKITSLKAWVERVRP